MKLIPYLPYVQYRGDQQIKPFYDAYSAMAQEYADWFSGLTLPIYTDTACSGEMLDWVALGIYGMRRPNLSSGNVQEAGEFNTVQFNIDQFNASASTATVKDVVVTDDIFKRCMTWNLYRGDGVVFNTRWLKRRVMRFLFGENGADIKITDTNQLSIIYSTNNNVTIRWIGQITSPSVGEINSVQFNTLPFNQTAQTLTGLPGATYIDILRAAIQSDALELPFQYKFSVA